MFRSNSWLVRWPGENCCEVFGSWRWTKPSGLPFGDGTSSWPLTSLPHSATDPARFIRHGRTLERSFSFFCSLLLLLETAIFIPVDCKSCFPSSAWRTVPNRSDEQRHDVSAHRFRLETQSTRPAWFCFILSISDDFRKSKENKIKRDSNIGPCCTAITLKCIIKISIDTRLVWPSAQSVETVKRRWVCAAWPLLEGGKKKEVSAFKLSILRLTA